MISVQQLSMHFTGDDLFTNINFLIREKDRIGLVGKNGSGKTTLLRLICGLENPHKGDVIVPEDISIGYLPQEKALNSESTVMEEALTAFDHIHQLEDKIKFITNEISNRTDYTSNEYHKLVEQLSFLNERLSIFSAHTIQAETEQILVGLGFEHEDMLRPMSTFSNGWQMRVELAKILLQKPDVLLLDEPTNHLDIESIEWLEGFLRSYNGAVVIVSHDRAFLDNVSQRTIEISQARIYDYKASYSQYLEMRNERLETQTAAYENQQREIREIERFIERFRYKATKAKQVQSRIKMLEKMEEIEIEELDKRGIHFTFPPAPHSGRVTLETNALHKSYGDLEVIGSLDMIIARGERIAFVGRNGEGKSTLAKILAGVLEYEGELKYGHQVEVGYYAQNQHEMLDMEKTVFETLDDVASGEIRKRLKAILGAFLFSGDAIDKKVKVLSGGEKARLSLARMLLFPVNLLILDEPTNHLDMHSKDILKTALLQFEGTLIVVSHDRDFLQGLTEKVVEFRKPNVKVYNGDVYDFLEARSITRLSELEYKQAERSKQESETAAPSQNKLNWEQRKLLERDKRKLVREIENTEEKIHNLEDDLRNRNQILQNPQTIEDGKLNETWYAEYEHIRLEIQRLMQQWENALQKLEEIEQAIEEYQ